MWFTIAVCSLVWLFVVLLILRWMGAQARQAETHAIRIAVVKAMLRREQAAALGDADILIDLEQDTPADVQMKLAQLRHEG